MTRHFVSTYLHWWNDRDRRTIGRAVPGVVCLVTVALAFAAVAQPRQNIAGTYRGLMTGCLTASQPGACRKGLAEIVRLADEVDAKYAVWARADGAADSDRADLLHKEYALAVDELNRGVKDFNRDMQDAGF